MDIFKLHENWDFPCSKSQNSICIDVGKHQANIVATLGPLDQSEVITGEVFIDATWKSTLRITPFPNKGFKADQKQKVIEVGPESHNIIFTFSELPEGTVTLEFDDAGKTDESTQQDRIEFNTAESKRNTEAILSILLAKKE